MSTYDVPSTMTNKFSNTETDSEEHDSTFSHGCHLTQPNDSFYADPTSSPLISRARSTLVPSQGAISLLTLAPNYLSTGTPRLVPEWRRCCECSNLVNPSLAPEKCPICSHPACDFCSKENVP
ncbi:hypothetical protein N7491_000448 [Penicillium cf. griseofulvum]|uniref:Uncharacterized protein n=1 Tax=Penicillium cf. griseofulvum TaxID=2972120 RepID=A0A9W9JL79_9EURO|nr:hypothetical protein N7472_004192 [Penicillium cf. griseofulvum]KAJ5443283.1 hypothetical protein N7445_004396 [Penicillium cf. griseofulvum]KAJ5451266.1 hypothetical protein N7491_000448 [Penicillium cf. griseofulvum]